MLCTLLFYGRFRFNQSCAAAVFRLRLRLRLGTGVYWLDGHMDNMEELFKSATKFVRTIAGKIENEALLYFYARFKQV